MSIRKLDEKALKDCLLEINMIPWINLGGCGVVAAELAFRIHGARVFPVARLDTDWIREVFDDDLSIENLCDNFGQFNYHVIVRLADGREADSTGLHPNGHLSKATGCGFSALEAQAWYLDRSWWNSRFYYNRDRSKVRSICNAYLGRPLLSQSR